VIANCGLMVVGASLAHIAKQLEDCFLAYARHPRDAANAVAFHHHSYDLCPFLCAQAIHDVSIMHDRPSIVKW
jgi:hypothetical protein